MIKEDKKGFILYLSWEKPIMSLRPEELKKLIGWIFQYQKDQIMPDDDDTRAWGILSTMSGSFDSNIEKWKKKSKIAAEKGQKGGITTQERRRQAKALRDQADALENEADALDSETDESEYFKKEAVKGNVGDSVGDSVGVYADAKASVIVHSEHDTSLLSGELIAAE